MQLFLSTTFYRGVLTDLDEVLALLRSLNIDGVELGSTHRHTNDIEDIVSKRWMKRLVTHNFFPPHNNSDFVMNIASDYFLDRSASIDHAAYCIEVAGRLGAEVYTIHPGFLARPNVGTGDGPSYDFNFSQTRINRPTAFRNMCEALSELIVIAKENNIKLAIETEGSSSKPGVLLMESMSEYDALFDIIGEAIFLNLNLAHTRFAASAHKYKVEDFIDKYYDQIALVEFSHNNGILDDHLPLVESSYVFEYIDCLPDVPYILEFRNASIRDVEKSIRLMREAESSGEV